MNIEEVFKKTYECDLYVLHKIEICNENNIIIDFKFVYDIYKKIKEYEDYINDIYNKNIYFDINDPNITPSIMYGGLFYIMYIQSDLLKTFLNSVSEKRKKLSEVEMQIKKMIQSKEYYASFYYIHLIQFEDLSKEILFYKDLLDNNIVHFPSIIELVICDVYELYNHFYFIKHTLDKLK